MDKARSLLENASTFFAAKGKKVINVNLKNEVVVDEIIKKFML